MEELIIDSNDMFNWFFRLTTSRIFGTKDIKTVNMNYFEAIEVFFTFLEAKPCHVH